MQYGRVISPNGGFLHWQYDIPPIGCPGPQNANILFCDVTWKLANDSGCSMSHESNPHRLCGLTFRGLTVAGLELYGSWGSALNNMYQNTTFVEEIPRTVIYGNKVIVADGTQSDVTRVRKLQFQPLSLPGNSFWNGYVFPDMKVCYSKHLQRRQF